MYKHVNCVLCVGIMANNINVEMIKATFANGEISEEIRNSCNDPAILDIIKTLIENIDFNKKIHFVDEDDM